MYILVKKNKQHMMYNTNQKIWYACVLLLICM